MYARVLAAINEHVNSEVAARYAKALARSAGADLVLCSIAEPGMRDEDVEHARDAVLRVQHAAREAGVAASVVLERGDPVSMLRDIAHAERVDLVFAATRREDVRRRFYAGRTVSRRLLHTLSCGVALARIVHLGRIHPHEVLVPVKEHIDHIPERALFTALMARAFGSVLNLFHAPRPFSRFFHGESHLTPLEWEARLPDDISRFLSHLEKHQVPHEKRLFPGQAGRSIAIEAAARRRDLIIMGASVRGMFDRLLRGTPMEYVLRETPCNLIIFRPGR